MIVPQGTSEANFRAALHEFAAVVGDDWVFTSEADIATYRDAYSPFIGQPDKMNMPGAAVSPTPKPVRRPRSPRYVSSIVPSWSLPHR